MVLAFFIKILIKCKILQSFTVKYIERINEILSKIIIYNSLNKI